MRNKKAMRGLAAVLAVVLLIGCSFAYFTDYATTQANGTAGTVALSMDSNINLLDADGQDIINPGDMRDGSFTVTNEGNKSIDVRTTIVLTTQSNNDGVDLVFTGDGATQSEYDLYLRDDVELVEGYGYMPKADAQPLQVKSVDQDTITYILPEYVLNGNSDKYDEVESVDGVNAFAHEYDFVMVMKGAAGNEWQNSAVSIDVLVEAKQHENTAAGWEIVAQENVTSGAINKDAVKGENVITENTATVTYIPVTSIDENGENLNATSKLIEGERADELLNSLDAAGLASKDDVDLLIDVKADNFDGMADTTFDVSNIANEGDTVVILHYDETKGEWEYIATETVADGKVSGDFSSYSPVAFVVISGEQGGSEATKEQVEGNLISAAIIHPSMAQYMGSRGYVASPLYDELYAAFPEYFEAKEQNEPMGSIYGVNAMMVAGDTTFADIEVAKWDETLYGGNGGVDAASRKQYGWTSYSVVGQTDSTLTLKFVCDEADFSNVALESLIPMPGDYSAIAIEGTDLTWTVTLDKIA